VKRNANIEYEFLKVRIDRIADARGITFSRKFLFIDKAMESMQKGQILKIYCSDKKHKDKIPEWITQRGHIFLSIVDEANYYKILVQKG